MASRPGAATLAQQRLDQIQTMRATWAAMRGSALDAAVPQGVLEEMDTTLTAIVAARKNAEDELARVLALQDRTVKDIGHCNEALARVAQDGNARRGPAAARDGR